LVTAIHGHGVHGDVPCRGSGSVPLWLADQFPKSQVDVVELEVRAERRGEKIGGHGGGVPVKRLVVYKP
jgi:hypothetical protein